MHRSEIAAAVADEDRHDTSRHGVPRSLEVGGGRETNVAEPSSGTTKSPTTEPARSYCATVMVGGIPPKASPDAGDTYPFTTNLCHSSKPYGASDAALAWPTATERVDTGAAIDAPRAGEIAGYGADAAACSDHHRTAGRRDIPVAGTQRQEPLT